VVSLYLDISWNFSCFVLFFVVLYNGFGSNQVLQLPWHPGEEGPGPQSGPLVILTVTQKNSNFIPRKITNLDQIFFTAFCDPKNIFGEEKKNVQQNFARALASNFIVVMIINSTPKIFKVLWR
jgi:hypothetical protein